MTASQNRLYFREWGSVRAACKAHGWPVPDRHELHVRALGFDKSHLDFNNEDLDKVLAEFRKLSAGLMIWPANSANVTSPGAGRCIAFGNWHLSPTG